MMKVELVPTNEDSGYYQEHIAGRHGKVAKSIGSKLLENVPDDYMLNILKETDKAYQKAIDDMGAPGRMVFAVQANRPVGTNALLPKENLDNDVIFSTIRDVGTPRETKVFVALISEQDMPETNIVHVIMGHYGPTGKAGIYTMICGDEGMPMARPVDENMTPEMIKFNDECKKYWDDHVFLITPEELKANIEELKEHGVSTKKQQMFLEGFELSGRKSPIIKAYQATVSKNAVKLQLASPCGVFLATKGVHD